LALISAARLGSRINKNMHMVLLTSNATLSSTDASFRVVLRDKNLPQSIGSIFEELLPQYVNS
jgi:hypothetical protein